MKRKKILTLRHRGWLGNAWLIIRDLDRTRHFFESNLCVVLKWCWQSLKIYGTLTVGQGLFFSSQCWWAVSWLLERPATHIPSIPKQHSGLTATLTHHQRDLFVFASHRWIPRDKKNIKKKHWKFEVATPVQTRRQVNRSITEIQGQSLLLVSCYCTVSAGTLR